MNLGNPRKLYRDRFVAKHVRTIFLVFARRNVVIVWLAQHEWWAVYQYDRPLLSASPLFPFFFFFVLFLRLLFVRLYVIVVIVVILLDHGHEGGPQTRAAGAGPKSGPPPSPYLP